jgi:ubiquinone/menaquinone biosynthesis C-methylase UbiE
MTQAGSDSGVHTYATGGTRDKIEEALRRAGKDPERFTVEDLGFLEDFHSLGRIATLGLLDLAGVSSGDRVLDAGSGIGGTARLLASQRGCHVTTVDLTADFCDTARWINETVGLSDLIDVHEGTVLDLPFTPGSFDVVVSQHVQMNIADKARLYSEARRVLVPGGRLALWDVTAGPVQPIRLPVPWASVPEHSHLVTADELRGLTTDAGFEVTAWNDLTEMGTNVMRQIAAAPPELGLDVYVPDFSAKLGNFAENGAEDRIRLIQAVLTARA